MSFEGTRYTTPIAEKSGDVFLSEKGTKEEHVAEQAQALKEYGKIKGEPDTESEESRETQAQRLGEHLKRELLQLEEAKKNIAIPIEALKLQEQYIQLVQKALRDFVEKTNVEGADKSKQKDAEPVVLERSSYSLQAEQATLREQLELVKSEAKGALQNLAETIGIEPAETNALPGEYPELWRLLKLNATKEQLEAAINSGKTPEQQIVKKLAEAIADPEALKQIESSVRSLDMYMTLDQNVKSLGKRAETAKRTEEMARNERDAKWGKIDSEPDSQADDDDLFAGMQSAPSSTT